MQRGKKLSPWTIINIMWRAKAGERTDDLAVEFAISRATINRWLLKWGAEADLAKLTLKKRRVPRVRREQPEAWREQAAAQ